MKSLLFNFRILLLATVLIGNWSCSDNDNDQNLSPEDPSKYGWGKTMAGNNPEEITWPDLCENYWEYTLDVTLSPNVGLRFKGEFPKIDTRFFNITLYDDASTQRITSIEDYNIIPDNGGINPFEVVGVTGKSTFEVNAVPSGTSDASKDKLKNILIFPKDTKRLCVLLRIYFNSTDHKEDFGGVELPEIVLFDLETGKELGKAVRAKSEYYQKFSAITKFIPRLTSQKALIFTLAPDVLYSNGPTGYVSSANRILPDSVLLFRFFPPHNPSNVAENRTADVRYWSICVGDTATYTRATIPDHKALKSTDGYVNVMIIEKTTPNYNRITAKAASMNINVIDWDNKTMGEGLMIFYRQMNIKEGYKHSVQRIPVYPPLSNGIPNVSVPIKPENMAHLLLGEYGPSGLKLPAEFILSESFGYQHMRIPVEK